MNSFSKFGLCKVGAYIMASLILSNASILSFVHFELKSFFIMSCSGFTISAKLEMNLVQRLSFQEKIAWPFCYVSVQWP